MVVTCNDKFKSASEGMIPNRIMVWSWVNEECKRKLSIDDELPMKATKVKWGPFDETLVAIFEEGQFVVWDAQDGSMLKNVSAHSAAITSLNFTEDRMLMITS